MAEAVKQIFRPKKGRKVAGVAMAFANYFNIDVTIVRLIWVVLFIPGGIPGLFLYIVCWIVIPDESD